MHKTNQQQLSYHQFAFSNKRPADIKQWFAPLCQQAWSQLLHSGDNSTDITNDSDKRFDIIVASPVASITSIGNLCTIQHYSYSTSFDSPKITIKHENGDPLLIAQQLQLQIFGETAHWPQQEDLPFIGGALGLLTYDLGRSLESLPAIAEADIDLPQMAIGFYDWALIFDKQKNKLTLVQHGNQQKLQQRLRWLEAQQQTPVCFSHFTLTSPWQANMSKNEYLDKFAQVQAYLLSGDCYQINLAQRFKASYNGDEWLAYCALIEENKTQFSAFLNFGSHKILSLSPERFMQVKQLRHEQQQPILQVQTKPIKGTRPRKANHEQDLIQINNLKTAEKDRAENLMIVDLLRNDISRVCLAGTVKVPKLFDIESYPAVHHMVSTIEGQLKQGKNAWDLLRATFPGGSITGAPKIRAMQIIEELEPQRRSAYCGSIFYISANGTMDSNITIRTLLAENNHLYCWGGGGLVADSIGEDEYQETLDKLAKILPVLLKL